MLSTRATSVQSKAILSWSVACRVNAIRSVSCDPARPNAPAKPRTVPMNPIAGIAHAR